MRIMRHSAWLVGCGLLAACATQPSTSVPPDVLETLPLPPDTLEQESASDDAVALRPQPVPVMHSTGQTGPGMLPGVSEQASAPAERGHFERRLQERQKRVHLGLDRPQREHEPVDNMLDFDF